MVAFTRLATLIEPQEKESCPAHAWVLPELLKFGKGDPQTLEVQSYWELHRLSPHPDWTASLE